jgi:hypothetical protein
MAFAADIPGLHVWADVAGVILLLELCVLLVVVTALIFALAYGMYWVHKHVIPVLDMTVPRAKQALAIANQGNDRVVRGVAMVYGFHQGLEAAIQALLRPRAAANQQQSAATTADAPVAAANGATTAVPAAADALPVDVLDIPQRPSLGPARRPTTPHAE